MEDGGEKDEKNIKTKDKIETQSRTIIGKDGTKMVVNKTPAGASSSSSSAGPAAKPTSSHNEAPINRKRPGKAFDYLVIESTGISMPLPVAKVFFEPIPHHAKKDADGDARMVKADHAPGEKCEEDHVMVDNSLARISYSEF